MNPASARLVLASTSRYRRALLDRFGLPFDVQAPLVDETALENEDPLSLCARLARLKALAVAERFPHGVVIGSDQIAVLGRSVLGKPGSNERCIEQLLQASGQRLLFHTAVHVIDKSQRHEAHVDTTTVLFRKLNEREVRDYVSRDAPLDCAGGFKAEALGIALLERIESQDPTALIGLPLIWLAGALRRAGFALP
jgi:septum formation protein